jgi:hypothetical protein
MNLLANHTKRRGCWLQGAVAQVDVIHFAKRRNTADDAPGA